MIDLISVEDASLILGVDRTTVIRYIKNGDLWATRPGRRSYVLDRREVDACHREKTLPKKSGRPPLQTEGSK